MDGNICKTTISDSFSMLVKCMNGINYNFTYGTVLATVKQIKISGTIPHNPQSLSLTMEKLWAFNRKLSTFLGALF